MAYVVSVDGKCSSSRNPRKTAIHVAFELRDAGYNVTAVESDLCNKAIPLDRLFEDVDPKAVRVNHSHAFYRRSERLKHVSKKL